MGYNDRIVEKLHQFIENEGKSCSMDYGCITPEYVYRMWGGTIALKDITSALHIIRSEYDYR